MYMGLLRKLQAVHLHGAEEMDREGGVELVTDNGLGVGVGFGEGGAGPHRLLIMASSASITACRPGSEGGTERGRVGPERVSGATG